MKTSIFPLVFLISAASSFVAPNDTTAQLVGNGGFESGTNPGFDFINVPTGNSTTISGWTIGSGNVDYIGGRWSAASGVRSVDLNGTLAGSISQNINGVTVGQTYRLYFYMAASPDAGTGASRTLQVNVGAVSQTFTAIGTGLYSAPGWSQCSLDFTANSSTVTLSFLSNNSGPWGPILDDVSIVSAPEPTGLLMICGGVLFLGLQMQKQRPPI